MKAIGLAVAILSLASSGAIAAPAPDRCDLPVVKYMGDLQSVLSRRAVEVVNRAAKLGSNDDVRLRQLVAPSADFSLGAGDVGRPLGKGVSGARALAVEMKADTFRYLGWNFIPTPVEAPCASQKVEIEFTDTRGRNVYPVTFTFKGGRVVAAEGWSRTFEAGALTPVGK
jgi:hypothetical protein